MKLLLPKYLRCNIRSNLSESLHVLKEILAFSRAVQNREQTIWCAICSRLVGLREKVKDPSISRQCNLVLMFACRYFLLINEKYKPFIEWCVDRALPIKENHVE